MYLKRFLVVVMFIWGGNSLVAQINECDEFLINAGQDFVVNESCTPVPVYYEVWYRNLPNPANMNYTLQIRIDWDDGNIEEVTLSALDYDSGKSVWTKSFNYLYVAGGPKCYYKPVSNLVINGKICSVTEQSFSVFVWDVDDENGGALQIDPEVFYICVGLSDVAQFFDVSQWNCVPDLLPFDEHNNKKQRWIQWIYGTNYLPGPPYNPSAAATTMIYNDPEVNPERILVDYDAVASTGIPYTGAPIPDVVQNTSEPIYGPESPSDTSWKIYIPAGFPVDSRFEITLNNWNQCNPYPTHPPRVTKAYIQIVEKPDASIIPQGPVCENVELVIFKPVTTYGGTWSCNNGGVISTTPEGGYFYPSLSGPGTYTIYYTVDGVHCPNTGETTITVRKSPTFTLNLSEPQYLCPDISLTIEISDIEAETDSYTILWSSNVPGVLFGTDDYFRDFEAHDVGDYIVTIILTDTNGCFTEKKLYFFVATISITFAPNIKVCQGMELIMNPIIAGGNLNYVYHEWTLIDPPGLDINTLLSATDIKNPTFQYNTPGIYVLKYKVIDSSGCEEEEQVTVNVIPQPVAVAAPYFEICEPQVTMEAEPWGGASGSWSVISRPAGVTVNFSPNNTFPNATVTFTPSNVYGTYKLEWRLTFDICYDADTVEILYVSKPTPGVIPDFEICGSVAKIQSIVSTGHGEWSCNFPAEIDFDDIYASTTNVTVNVPITTSHTYAFTWTETLTGENQSHCKGEATMNVTFNPQAEAIIAPVDPACSPNYVVFENNSTNADNWYWDSGHGDNSTVKNPSFEYYATDNLRHYIATLIAKNSFECNDTTTTDIYVIPKPVSAFVADPVSGCSPIDVTFTNNSIKATNYDWYVNYQLETSTTNNQPFIHTFINDKQFVVYVPRVTLVAGNKYLISGNEIGCVDSVFTYITVYPEVNISLVADPSEGCDPLITDLISSSGYDLTWDFGWLCSIYRLGIID